MLIEKKELNNIKGGASSAFWLTLGGMGIFLIGFLEGLRNPFKCLK